MIHRRLQGLFLLLSLAASPHAWAVSRYSCLPSCSATDARFLSIADPQLTTLAEAGLEVMLSVPPTSTHLRFGVFDGDAGGRWDSAEGTVGLFYTLFADPQADGSGSLILRRWTHRDFADNAWTSLAVTAGAEALAEDGNLYYRLAIRAEAQALGWTNLKIRLEDGALFLPEEPIALSAPLLHPADVLTVYPAFPSLAPTTYSGDWDLYLDSRSPLARLELWDGDFDYGSSDCVDSDDDDPETANEEIQPEVSGAGFEGVALGEQRECGWTTGAPADDAATATLRRAPSVGYGVTLPNGVTYPNLNPSGNGEWECFVLATDPGDLADHTVASLPAGIYQVRLTGLDLNNLVVLRLAMTPLGVDEEGRPVPLLPPRERPVDD